MNFRNLRIAAKINVILTACGVGLLSSFALLLAGARADLYADQAMEVRGTVFAGYRQFHFVMKHGNDHDISAD